jgi:cytochrome P450
MNTRNAYFDTTLDAWVLSTYDDVMAAFRSDVLRPASAFTTSLPETVDDEPRLRMRAETTAALSPAQLETWRAETTRYASELVSFWKSGSPVDLLTKYARPLCEHLALLITRPLEKDVAHLFDLAAQVSAAAAEPSDRTLAAKGDECDAELAKHFTEGPSPLRQSGFVALSQTLPALLSRFWLALVEHPAEWTRLHDEPALMRKAVEELFRYTGLAEQLFRIATADVTLNGITIRAGQRVMLRIQAANRDAACFTPAHTLDSSVPREPHLSLGIGRHSCVGGPLLRMITAASTGVLVQRFRSATLAGQIEWRGGSGFRFPAALNVILHEE